MNARHALSLSRDEAVCLGPLRRWSAFEVCEAEETLWLRAARLEDEQWEYCRRLPGAERFEVLADGQLLPVGARVPRGYLPAGPWEVLHRWLQLELPAAETALATPFQTALRLVRSSEPRPASWLLASLAEWSAYVETAPLVRLARWSFAADAAGRAAIRGAPLPPLRGTQYVEESGLAVPAGWHWSPAVEAAVVRAALRLEPGDCALWFADGAWQKIAAGDWVRATRSAVRLTLEEQRRG
ncbi:MAG TPA: hypothetical protein VMV10_14885 [Pirellulales bacterium]|nr:hypothetical protein [Pirellulales bacterium]